MPLHVDAMPAHVLPTISPSPYAFVAPADLPADLPLSTCMGIPRTVAWHAPSATLYVIDQQALPSELRYVAIRDVDTVLAAIIDMTVRGAPAIGAAGAYALAMTAATSAAATPYVSRTRARTRTCTHACTRTRCSAQTVHFP